MSAAVGNGGSAGWSPPQAAVRGRPAGQHRRHERILTVWLLVWAKNRGDNKPAP